MDAAASPQPGSGGNAGPLTLAWRLPPQLLFVIGALTQYVGAGLAVLLFARVPVIGVAWLRVFAAAVVMAAWARPWRLADARGWTRERLLLVGGFGLALAGMNGAFYLAIDRLPLGTAVALEFVGPIAVTAIGSHGRRDLITLATAAAGVLLLADVHVSGSPLGVALALAAGACWAGYVVLGHRVAADPGISGRPGLAAAMIAGTVALAPFGASSSLDAFTHPALLAACVGVGLMSSVIPYVLDQVAMARLPRARFALLLALLPATATVAGLVVLHQIPGIAETIGIALVVAATALGSHQR
ncbi:EamA family transporter [Conexibacter sp. JD483]|uniref:EamA family transporter n=1 Tax=unclassified Conexibacter TaxID=2627773 RepID=UPI00272345C3|nr:MULTISPECIES: EamA family transporter [unclassified Conexibacter]MDO8185408.1 EamA family transporter [Conexibacter sp. CPCC 205706]MDO8198416.1 EamA family transporter [Conexibacter sp. CPCC 205762]MDR9369378.1 EamA family transporter [Conexibacter sp. JD483]